MSIDNRKKGNGHTDTYLLIRVDFLVLPLLYLGFFTFQLDRMNIASALTGGFASDINVSQSTINLGNQLMYMGTVVFEIPCNMAQQKVRAEGLVVRKEF